MNQNILKYLLGYSYNVWDVNRLLVSSFLIVNNIAIVKNELINSYIIPVSDNIEHQQLLDFINLLNYEEKKFGIEELMELFEFVISPVDKEVNGAVFTPQYIREHIVKVSIDKYLIIEKNISIATFGDIACGCGGFFKTIAELIRSKTSKSYYDIYKENIYGLDIQDYSIERTKIILSLLAILDNEDNLNFEFNLYTGNALNFDWNEVEEIKRKKGFDIIVGNPPYVGATKIDIETKKLLKKWSVSSTGKSDLYIPFFEIGMENLNQTGILGFITVNTFYKSLNGRSVRSYFSKNKYDISIIDFGGEQLFKKRSTYTCICIIGKPESLSIKYLNISSKNINTIKKKDFINIPYSTLNDFDGWYLNDKQIAKNITKIENTGSSLGNKFEIRNGFATLKNNIYLFKPINESDNFYHFIKDKIEYRIEKGICRDAIKPNTLKSECEISEHMEKLIFPYLHVQKNNLFGTDSKALTILDEPHLRLNYPLTYEYLLSQKEILSKRDKGSREYEKWYAFGRNQALILYGYKLLFPYISSIPCFVFTEKKELLFYNGYAVFSDSIEDLRVVQKILMSKIFWYYIKHTSKPYEGGYFSLAKNYVKNFGVCDLSQAEKELLLATNDTELIDDFLKMKYEIQID